MKLSRGAQVVREAGYGSLREFRQARVDLQFQSMAAAWAEARGMRLEDVTRSTSRFSRMYGRTFYRKGKKLKDPSRKAGGRLAKLLEALEWRPRNAPYPVGDTP